MTSRGLDASDTIGAVVVLVADRHVLSLGQAMPIQPIGRLIIIRSLDVVIDQPSGTAGTTGAVHQLPDPIGLARPKTPDSAPGPLARPFLRVEMPVRVERGDEVIAMQLATGRVIGASREMKYNVFQHCMRLVHDQCAIRQHSGAL